ncbi:MAG: ABC transporter ATP-binding protein [Rhodospirillaceae bacterium]|nr:MAG: ABC transporter ATP-binding protein [Rhodospirillaceae bacterium]
MITVQDIAISYPGIKNGPAVIQDISLSIRDGSIVSLIGPSGCGKSTLLKAIAGLVPPSRGRMDIAGIAPQEAAQRRLVGLVFQEANLLPWKTALDNAAFLLQVSDKRVSAKEARERAGENLKLVGLGDALTKLPSQLSGGMRQRASIARALTLNPQILLMDEPFGALDAITREEMSYLILDIWERTGKTIVLVTHSIDEAVLLSHEVHVMGAKPGRIVCSITVPLAFPRNSQSFADPRFRETEILLRDRLIESHGRSRQAS